MNKLFAERRTRRPEYWIVLVSICMMSVFFYGIRAAAVMGLAAVTAVLTDFFCLFLQGKAYRTADLSNAAAAVIMVLMFPATIPYSIVILSTVFMITVGIHAFGSRGDYLFPPAAVGYLFALLCWKHEVLQFPEAGQPLALFGNDAAVTPSLSSAILTERVLKMDVLDLLTGAAPSPMGTGCILLLAVGLLVLVCRRCVSYWAFLGFVFSITMLSMWGVIPAAVLFSANMLLFALMFLIGDMAAPLQGSFSVLCGSLITGMLTWVLLEQYHLEYAVIIAVLLTSPVWQLLAAMEKSRQEKRAALAAEPAAGEEA